MHFEDPINNWHMTPLNVLDEFDIPYLKYPLLNHTYKLWYVRDMAQAEVRIMTVYQITK